MLFWAVAALFTILDHYFVGCITNIRVRWDSLTVNVCTFSVRNAVLFYIVLMQTIQWGDTLCRLNSPHYSRLLSSSLPLSSVFFLCFSVYWLAGMSSDSAATTAANVVVPCNVTLAVLHSPSWWTACQHPHMYTQQAIWTHTHTVPLTSHTNVKQKNLVKPHRQKNLSPSHK